MILFKYYSEHIGSMELNLIKHVPYHTDIKLAVIIFSKVMNMKQACDVLTVDLIVARVIEQRVYKYVS